LTGSTEGDRNCDTEGLLYIPTKNPGGSDGGNWKKMLSKLVRGGGPKTGYTGRVISQRAHKGGRVIGEQFKLRTRPSREGLSQWEYTIGVGEGERQVPLE